MHQANCHEPQVRVVCSFWFLSDCVMVTPSDCHKISCRLLSDPSKILMLRIKQCCLAMVSNISNQIVPSILHLVKFCSRSWIRIIIKHVFKFHVHIFIYALFVFILFMFHEDHTRDCVYFTRISRPQIWLYNEELYLLETSGPRLHSNSGVKKIRWKSIESLPKWLECKMTQMG